jgi:nucleotide-binding universal stress UspA family protein
MARRDGTPIWLGGDGAAGVPLSRVALTSGSAESYSEAWLQDLLDRHPEVLPIERIEPGFGKLISLCRELPLDFGAGRSGALDNLFATESGGLVLVETKLWKNPEARRTVVAQAMDYAAAVFRLGYEDLERAVDRARKAAGQSAGPLTQLVAKHAHDSFDEPTFIDAVTLNLRRGRAIVAVVGDGIREDIAPLVELLQSDAGLRFVFALVELGVYEVPSPGVRLVCPSVLAQTTLIERGVVQIDDQASGILIRPPAVTGPRTQSARRIGLSEDEFYEILERNEPGMAALLKDFRARAEAHGIYPEVLGGLNLKHSSPSGQPFNLGVVTKSGKLDTGFAGYWERAQPGRTYNETLARLIGGRVKELGNGMSIVHTAADNLPRLSDFLPQHAEAWLEAIDNYTAAFINRGDRDLE